MAATLYPDPSLHRLRLVSDCFRGGITGLGCLGLMRTLYCALIPAVMWAVMWAIAPVCPALAQERTNDVWLLTAGTEVDDEGGYRLDLGLAWSPKEATLISALAARADSSTDFN